MDFAFQGVTSMDDRRFVLLNRASRLRGNDE